LPYGLEALTDRFELVHPDRSWTGFAGRVVESLEYRTDRKVGQVLASLGVLRSTQACVSIFEDFGLTYAALQRFAPGLPPMLLMTCWMSQRLLTFAHQQRTAFRRLFERAAAVTVFSANQVPIIAGILQVPEDKIHVLDFGVVTDYFTPLPAEREARGYIATVGQDAGRDWPTLFRAAADNPRLSFRLAAWPREMKSYAIPPNVEFVGGLAPDAYRSLLQHADLVVVASHPLPYPTGQSVLLESLSCGKAVIASRSAALRTYVDNPAVVTYEAGDAEQLSQAIRRLAPDHEERRAMGRAGRQIVLERFDSRAMWGQVGDLLDGIA
jgi:glycosyltransferase involved in cell wall biosynthesis